MVKKKAASTAAADETLGAQIKASAQQIWLAGMGAFARAQAEGTKRFESLVKDGGALQKKTQSAAEDRLGEMASKMSSLAGDVQSKAGLQWDKLESIFDDRTSKALKKLSVPSAQDLHTLSVRLDALSAKVAALSATAPAKKASSAAKRAAVPRKTTPAATGPVARAMERVDELTARAFAPRPAATKSVPMKQATAKPAAKRAARTTTPR